MKTKKSQKTSVKSKEKKVKTPKQEVVLTRDEFLQTLKKVTRPTSPKVSPSKGK